MQNSLQQWLDRYGESHQNHTNKRIHHICVPLIFMTIVGFLYNLSPTLTLAVSAVVAIFYLRLGLKPLLLFCFMLGVSVFITRFLSLSNPILLLVFILAWIGQFIGHKIEGAKPSFFEDLQFLLIGPLWVFSSLLKNR